MSRLNFCKHLRQRQFPILCVNTEYVNMCISIYKPWFSASQFFPGEEHAVVLPEDHEAEVRQLRLCSAATDAQYTVREHQERNLNM